jgi:hypothetical protein
MYPGEQMSFTDRLNAILPRITEEGFLQKKGLGKEIPFYVFDYPPEEELKMREHISFIIERMSQQHAHVRILHIKLFDFIVQHLRERGNLDKAFTLEAEKGSKALWNALSASVKPDRLIKLLDEKNHPADHDIVFISGVGTIWPWVRAHSLLNNLQSVTGNASVVLFYPGTYNGQSFKLFDRLKTNSYYRAFRLVP